MAQLPIVRRTKTRGELTVLLRSRRIASHSSFYHIGKFLLTDPLCASRDGKALRFHSSQDDWIAFSGRPFGLHIPARKAGSPGSGLALWPCPGNRPQRDRGLQKREDRVCPEPPGTHRQVLLRTDLTETGRFHARGSPEQNGRIGGYQMKRIIAVVFILASLLLGANALGEADLTLLVYMCGADIQSDACEDIYEMGIAETGENVNIVLLAGGADEWDFEEIEGNTRNLIEIRDGYFESITDWGWASMGSRESLLEFLEYGLTYYPARRTAVILWDHGAGSEAGICFDPTTQEEDGLSLLEISQVLSDLKDRLGSFRLDLFGCDACMMATYEMAAMLSNYDIGYFVASEELEPGIGWHYTPWLEALDRNPALSTEKLCHMIVDSYMAAGKREDPDDYLTMSVIDLKKMGPLQEAMETLGLTLQRELTAGHEAEIRRGRSRMYTFGSFMDGSWDMVDLGAMLDAYSRFDRNGTAKARQALSDAVLVSKQTDNLDPCCGLSVLIPHDTKSEFESYADGVDLSFCIPNWIGFVKAYAGQLTGGSYSFSQTTPQNITGSGFLSQIASAYGSQQNEWCWNDAAAAYEEAPSPSPSVSASEGDYAFSAGLSIEDLRYLDYVEGMIMMDISDEESFGYVDLGLMRNNVVDWNSGTIYSLFDGTWPVLGDQLVPLYDQIVNEYGRRSLIPVKLNGEYTYLVVEFRAGSGEGRILGANAGYDDSGLPIRSTTKLKEGDLIIPVYTLYIETEDQEDLQESEVEGDPIRWREGMTVTYMDLSDESGEDEPMPMMFCFVLNDVFGGYEMTDLIPFEL